MSTECYKRIRFTADVRAIIDAANSIIAEFNSRLTLRQLYYQFIGRDAFPASWIDAAYNAKNGLQADTKNTLKNYKRLGGILSDARLAGEIDWDSLEDRGRTPHIWQESANLSECVAEAVRYFRLPRCVDQPNYVELWVEKDALAGVLSPIASQFHVPLIVNKGYTSSSAMRESAVRIIERSNQVEADTFEEDRPEQERIILYLGDFDPSGEDMVRDIRDRLETFGVRDLDVRKLALTREQIRQYRLPPNPAKMTDSRATAYVAEHGNNSWELDALPPTVFEGLVTDAIREVMDMRAYARHVEEEQRQRAALQKALDRIKKGKKS
jgi:hypothetical protein